MTSHTATIEADGSGVTVPFYLSRFTQQDFDEVEAMTAEGSPVRTEALRFANWLMRVWHAEHTRRLAADEGTAIIGPIRPTIPSREWSLKDLFSAMKIIHAWQSGTGGAKQVRELLFEVGSIILVEIEARAIAARAKVADGSERGGWGG